MCAQYRWAEERRAGGSDVARASGGVCCVVSWHSGRFSTQRDWINWKESDTEGDRKAICSLGLKGSVFGRSEGGELLHRRKQRKQF